MRLCPPHFVAAALMACTSAADSQSPRCNPDPTINQVVLHPLRGDVQAFADALINDAAFREQMGGITFLRITGSAVVAEFPELDDPEPLLAHLRASGAFYSAGLNSSRACFIPPPDKLSHAVEYYNASLDHYFMTADAGEKAVLDSGTLPGWSRTGEQFRVVIEPGCHNIAIFVGMRLVYRFYRKPIGGPDTHFFTISETECGKVRDDPFRQWQFEGVPFWAAQPTPDGCPVLNHVAGGRETVPVFRIYNNGKSGAPNHRYTTRREVVDTMVGEGWVEEGVTMCVDGRNTP